MESGECLEHLIGSYIPNSKCACITYKSDYGWTIEYHVVFEVWYIIQHEVAQTAALYTTQNWKVATIESPTCYAILEKCNWRTIFSVD